MINKLNIAKFTLGITKDYIGSQSSIEGLTGPEADLDKSLKGNKEEKLKYVDNMMSVFDFLTQLKEEKITEEDFSKNVSDIVEAFEEDTKVKEESDKLKDYRKRRDSIRNRGRSGTLVPPPPTFEVLEGGITLAELFENAEKYENKKITVSGEVVKFNEAIMNGTNNAIPG